MASKRAAVYLRVSSKKQERKETPIEVQRSACVGLAAERGYHVEEWHVFADTWLGTEYARPKLDELKVAIERGEIDVVVCYHIDRLARDPEHAVVLRHFADEHGVDLEFVSDEFPDTDEGRLYAYILGLFGKKEHARIRQRTNDGKANRRARGLITVGARPRYGYKLNADKTRYVLANDQTTETVRTIFRWAAHGISARQIARRLTGAGVPTPSDTNGTKGYQWAVGVVTGIIRDRTYLGQYAFLRTRFERKDGKCVAHKVPEDKLEWVEGMVEPMIVADQWRVANDLIDTKKQRAIRNAKDPEAYLLRGGILRCGYCGCAAIATRNGKDGHEYKCGPLNRDKFSCPGWSISTSVIDVAVWQRVEALLRDPEAVAREVQRTRGNEHDPTRTGLPLMEQQLAQLEREHDVIKKRWAREQDEDLAAILRDELKLTERRIVEVGRLRDELLARRRGWETARQRLAEFSAWCQAVAAELEGLGYAERRWAIEMLGVRTKAWARGHDPRYEITMEIEGLVPEPKPKTVSRYTCPS